MAFWSFDVLKTTHTVKNNQGHEDIFGFKFYNMIFTMGAVTEFWILLFVLYTHECFLFLSEKETQEAKGKR